jgi:uncharacterized membrane protein YbaN (DUF454 family)
MLKATTRKVFDWTAGLTLIGVGIVGGFIPILQGWIFILAGLTILSRHSRFAHRMNEKVKSMGRNAKERVIARSTRANPDASEKARSDKP